MRIWQYKIFLARHLGMPMGPMGEWLASDFLALVREVEYQRAVERYHIEYRLGQIMCILANSKQTKYKPNEFVGNEPLEVTKMAKPNVPNEIVLGDGNTYKLAPLDVNMMEDIEEEYDKSWGELFTNVRARVIKTVLYHMLKKDNPGITKDQVGALVTAKVLPELVKLIGDMA